MFHDVALIKGEDRLKNIKASLGLLKDEILPSIRKTREITIKPNMVTTRRQLAATHKDAIKGFLRFLVENNYKGKIVIAESPAIGNAMEGFKNYRYNKLKGEFKNKFQDFSFIDLNSEDAEEKSILDRNECPLKIMVSRRILNAEYLVSIGPAKTHDTVGVTLSIKNAVMGAILRQENRFLSLAKRKIWGDSAHTNYKAMMHQGYKMINRNIAKLAKQIPIRLAIIDATEAMEGNGPCSGTPKKLDWCLTSSNALAADTVAAKLMGFNPDDIGYLYHLGASLKDIKILGNSIGQRARKLKPHETYGDQLKWK